MGYGNCTLLFELFLFRSQPAFGKKAFGIFCGSNCFDNPFYGR
jgi:hypothetical protein